MLFDLGVTERGRGNVYPDAPATISLSPQLLGTREKRPVG